MSDSGPADSARQHYETARSLHRQGKLVEAERHYQAAGQSFPNHPGVLHGLGLICLRTHRTDVAADFLERAAGLAPQDAAIRNDLGTVNLLLGRYGDAARSFEKVLATRPGDATALMGLGDALSVLGRAAEAQDAFEKLLESDPGHAAAHFGLGNILSQFGRPLEARRAFERAVALAPGRASYHRALAESERFSEADPRLVALEELASDVDAFDDNQKVELHFALAKAYDDLERYGKAFEHLSRGNAIKRRLVSYDEASVAEFFHSIATVFTPELLRAKRGGGHPSELPVFVVGMPRSGSTLVEQMLASHPSVAGTGELLYVSDLIAEGYAGANYPASITSLPDKSLQTFGQLYCERIRELAPEALRIVDKLPANFRHLGLIHLALPSARIIHVRRDPVDTCFSCYSRLFLSGQNYTYDLAELGRYHKLYEGLMAHWRAVLPEGAMLEVQYENLATNFENEAQRIVAFCDLPWNERCLQFHKTERAVRTMSQAQVRQPLFTSSIGRWRHYESHLQPLLDALA